jgi:RNA polymerase sigma-70 factor (ECF subfamily)
MRVPGKSAEADRDMRRSGASIGALSLPMTHAGIRTAGRVRVLEGTSANTGDSRLSAVAERELVRRIVSGDRDAFARLLDAYETRVYRLALRLTGAVPDAEDVTQEIFLAVYRSLPKYRGDAALGTWIYRVAMNHCMEFRRRRRLDTVPYDAELTVTSTDWREDPQASAVRAETSARIGAALDLLSPLHRDVVIMHELHGLTYQEVAQALDLPVGTVKSRLSNAFRRLRELLGAAAYEGTLTS